MTRFGLATQYARAAIGGVGSVTLTLRTGTLTLAGGTLTAAAQGVGLLESSLLHIGPEMCQTASTGTYTM